MTYLPDDIWLIIRKYLFGKFAGYPACFSMIFFRNNVIKYLDYNNSIFLKSKNIYINHNNFKVKSYNLSFWILLNYPIKKVKKIKLQIFESNF